MKDRNATQAYIRAGYAAEHAESNATRMMGNDGVRAEIARRVEEYSRTAPSTPHPCAVVTGVVTAPW